MSRLPISDDDLATFCRRNHIRKLSLVGSVLKGTALPNGEIESLSSEK